MAYKGKLGTEAEKLMKGIFKGASKGTDGDKTKEVEKMTVKAFKEQGGTFVKGEAIGADGRAYTGILTKTSADDAITTMEYDAGRILSSTRQRQVADGGLSTISKKTFGYDAGERVVEDYRYSSVTRTINDETKGTKTIVQTLTSSDPDADFSKVHAQMQITYQGDNPTQIASKIKMDGETTMKTVKDFDLAAKEMTERNGYNPESKTFEEVLPSTFDDVYYTQVKGALKGKDVVEIIENLSKADVERILAKSGSAV